MSLVGNVVECYKNIPGDVNHLYNEVKTKGIKGFSLKDEQIKRLAYTILLSAIPMVSGAMALVALPFVISSASQVGLIFATSTLAKYAFSISTKLLIGALAADLIQTKFKVGSSATA